MLELAAILLAIAAGGGLVAAVLRVQTNTNPPMTLSLAHGAAGAAGLVLVVTAGVIYGFEGHHGPAAMILMAAALGGFVLFGTHLRDRLLSDT